LVAKRLKIEPSAMPARLATSAVVARMPFSRNTARAAARMVSSLMVDGRGMGRLQVLDVWLLMSTYSVTYQVDLVK
jgi:hypothetical protein